MSFPLPGPPKTLPSYDVSCQESVPEAIVAFLESADLETAIGNAVSLSENSDTQACIAGSIAEALYGGGRMRCGLLPATSDAG